MLFKSIAAFVKIASDIGEASCLCAVFADGTEATYPHDGMLEIMRDAGTGRDGDGLLSREVPVICLCDCMYDLILSWESICQAFDVRPIAKAPTDIYALRLHERQGRGREACVLFDLKHVMPRGLTGMAEVTGMDRDGTAMQDCRIMRAYAETLIDEHALFDPQAGELLGTKVLTLTGMARHEIQEGIGQLSYERRIRERAVSRNLMHDYFCDATREAPRTYEQYAMRKACMRGGLTFNAARESNKVHGRTVAIDETSAFHAQVMCRYVPEEFKPRDRAWLQAAAEKIVTTTPAGVLRCYHMPFIIGMHAEVEFEGLRLREGSVFAAQEIGLVSTGRFAASEGVEGVDNASAVEAERAIRAAGFRDTVEAPVTAFGKIMSARRLTTWVTEIELWCMSRVYEWDAMHVLRGEAATKRKRPDDVCILTSMHFWERKQTAKQQVSETHDARMAAIYNGEIKPQFNAIGYGLHARDEMRPGYEIDETGEWALMPAVSPEDFDERRPKRSRTWYTYGIRIAGGARMHMILAMELLYDAFGDACRIAAGDTDSLKLVTEIEEGRVLSALKPLHDATRAAIARVTERACRLWPDHIADMTGVGEFVTEHIASQFYTPGCKQYALLIREDSDGLHKPKLRLQLTLAGIPRDGDNSYAAWLRQMIEAWGPKILETVFAFDTQLEPDVSQLRIMDYGAAGGSELPQVQSLPYTLNSLEDPDNRATVAWQREHDRNVFCDSSARCAWMPEGACFFYGDGRLTSYD